VSTIGLRERQRIAVREELRTAAWDLFIGQGFDLTSVSDIAARVGVAERTFYRYFPTKEDAALDLADALGPQIRDRVRTAAGGEVIWDVLCEAMATAADVGPETPARVQAINDLARESGRLKAALAMKYRDWEVLLAEAIGAAVGVDPRDDDRPLYLASAALTIARVAETRAASHGVTFAVVVRQGFQQMATELTAVRVPDPSRN
jgi:AcrR family transcriptional regulator